ncbi:MAG TPA: YggS family pyridoxal phosphate-dependent enzyme [Pirellulales bacterium]|nr:YggS family pyridoxal phosphate-dependent enzyme [Pirellulales bacterium]
MSDARRIADNLAHVRERIAAAAARAGRTAEGITLVAVTKYAEEASIETLIDAGCHDLGESRPQQLWQRAERFAHRGIRWHMIGHVQRNKVARTLPLVSLLHSCDSLRLAESIEHTAAEQKIECVPVLVEVNISADPAKHGFAAGEMAASLHRFGEFQRVQVRGLMAMAGRADDAVAARDDFRRLRQLRDDLRAAAPVNVSLDELSMGMSGDYEVAIEEGATIVRVGSALFE